MYAKHFSFHQPSGYIALPVNEVEALSSKQIDAGGNYREHQRYFGILHCWWSVVGCGKARLYWVTYKINLTSITIQLSL